MFDLPEIPDFLSRKKHPELNMSKRERTRLDTAERVRRHQEAVAQAEARKRRKQAERLAQLHKRNPMPGTVDFRIMRSLERKLSATTCHT